MSDSLTSICVQKIETSCSNALTNPCGARLQMTSPGAEANSAATHWLSWGTAIGVAAMALAHQGM